MLHGNDLEMPGSLDSTATDAPEVTISSPGLDGATSPAATVPTTARERERNHVRYAPNIDTSVPPQTSSRLSPLTATAGSPNIRGPARSDTELSRASVRRRNRANTFKTIKEFDFDDFAEPGWHPGAEPGVDTSKPNHGHVMGLHAECQVTVVDFSQDDIATHELDNKQLAKFLDKPKPDWVKCRWINVNGLSWDVIQALGNYKNLHRLAVEDVMNTRNRTKVDWYARRQPC